MLDNIVFFLWFLFSLSAVVLAVRFGVLAIQKKPKRKTGNLLIYNIAIILSLFVVVAIIAPPAESVEVNGQDITAQTDGGRLAVASESSTLPKSTPTVETSPPSEVPQAEEAIPISEPMQLSPHIDENDIAKIVNTPNLPLYYDDLSSAKEFAKSFHKDIIITSGHDYVEGKTILQLSGDNDYINSIVLYSKNTSSQLSLGQLLELTTAFIPNDIMQTYYEAPVFLLFTPDDKSKDTYAVVRYGLNQLGQENYHSLGLTGNVTIIFHLAKQNKDVVEYIEIRFIYKNSWLTTPDKWGYSVSDFSFD